MSVETFSAALETSAKHAGAADAERHAASLHLEDLALACACAAGHDAAWEHFVRQYRPALYRAADAIDPGGGARELADALYADLFGLQERDGVRRSLFRYFHGRSSLATWLRAVLAQRHLDRLRAERRLEALPEEPEVPSAPSRGSADPEHGRFIIAITAALADAVAALVPRDRLRLSCYYAQDLTLAAIGRLLGEHEATVSRHLSRTRREIRRDVERRLRDDHEFDERAIAQCFEAVADDPGSLDLGKLLADRAGVQE